MFKFLLSDNESLDQYIHGKFASFEDVKRRIFLKAREQNNSIPDHIYRLTHKEEFKELDSISSILTIGLEKLASKHLELDKKKVLVLAEQQNNWQELITYIPPLLLQSALLQKETHFNDKSVNEIHRYFKEYILPNTKYTSIPSPRIPQLDYYVNQQNGLYDLHMHLNGALETDQVWQDYLFNPNLIYVDLKKGFSNPKVKEQLEQESRLLEPLTYVTLLKAAQKLRQFFFDFIFPDSSTPTNYSKESILFEFLNNGSDIQGGYKHPFLSLISDENKYPYLMSIEGLMYALILNELKLHKNELLANFFHFYLLILGLTNRLLVQQMHQNGFEQFQKHTLNELRENSEKTYLRRYMQMHGNDLRFIRFLEGRFSPKDTEIGMIEFINSIWKGWDVLKKEISLIESYIPQNKLPELRLIAHFIKKEDSKPDDYIRHKNLRYELFQKGNVLAFLIKNRPAYREKIVAVDAAASEFDSPPEVFAPTFRMMRRAGVKHFTYHAGEDFYHILCGLRAIYEAIEFCDLQKGDRIGHATATGLSPQIWKNAIGNQIIIKQGDYLDDLIFSYHIILKNKIKELHGVIPFITNIINDISFQIYNVSYPIYALEQSWLMRQSCPIHALEKNKEDVENKHVYNDDEWNFVLQAKFIENRQSMESNVAWEIFQKYHNNEYRSRFDKTIIIDPFDVLTVENIESLQLTLLGEMTKREIVIETLPTSNVRIGFHKNFSTYHLFNWMKWKDEGKSIPPIVVGSDDTGIFATNIYNEYANIYCSLINDHNMSHSSVMDIIKKLDEDSRIYKFG